MDFEARLHRASQRSIPQKFNSGYPPLVTVYLRHPPVLLQPDGTVRQPLALDPRVLEVARKLGEWVDVMVIPSNTPHLFLDEIRAAAGCEVLSIVDVTVGALPRPGPVGLLGFGIPAVYAERLAAEGFEFVTADETTRNALDAAVLRVMEGAETDADRRTARDALRQVRDSGVARTVLGCTEIPLLLGEAADADDLVNPGELLAEAAVRWACA